MDVEVRIVDAAKDIAATDWEALTTNPYQSRGWFLAMEESLPQTRFLYFCAYEQDRPRAILTVYDRHAPVAPDTITKLVAPAGRRVTRLANLFLRRSLSVLIAGSPYSYVSDVIGDPACDQLLIDALRSHAGTHGVDLVSFLFCRRELPLEDAISGPCIDDFELELPGDSPDGYFATFRNRKSRHGRRREFRNARPCALEPLAGHGELLSQLSFVTASRYGHAVKVPPVLYENLARHLGEAAKVLLIEENGEPTAILAVIEDADRLWLFHIGVKARDTTYFDILFSHPIRRAYELGLAGINYRPAGDDAKERRGCRRVPTRFYCLPVTRKARAAIGLVNGLVRLGGGGRGGEPDRQPPEQDSGE